MNPAHALQFVQLRQAGKRPQPDNSHILGMSALGGAIPSTPEPWPCQQIAMPLLGDQHEPVQEYWCSSLPCQRGHFGAIHFSASADMLFGVIDIDETTMPGEAAHRLQTAAETVYRQIFGLLEQQGFSYLWRMWNYIPRINQTEHGLERYRQFNIGRHQAFAACARPVGMSPAACALGTRSGKVSVAFLAGRRPVTCIENPRQVSAFAYPAEYGPRSPTFSRAALLDLAGEQWLFISGTASIVGHQTLHPGDVVAQTQESMRNIAVLLEQAGLAGLAPSLTLPALEYRVYVRQPADQPQIAATLTALLGPQLQAIYVVADICRADLLVEIEAHGRVERG